VPQLAVEIHSHDVGILFHALGAKSHHATSKRRHESSQMDTSAVAADLRDGVIVTSLHGTQLAGVPLHFKAIAGRFVAVHVESIELDFFTNVFLDDGANVAAIATSADGTSGGKLSLAMVASLRQGRVPLVAEQVRGAEGILQISFAGHGNFLDEGIQDVHDLGIDLDLTIGSHFDALLGAHEVGDQQKTAHLEIVVAVVLFFLLRERLAACLHCCRTEGFCFCFL